MADKEKQKDSKKVKGEGEEKDGKSTKEAAKDAKSKKDKDSTGPLDKRLDTPFKNHFISKKNESTLNICT